jgi:hypothetical protein
MSILDITNNALCATKVPAMDVLIMNSKRRMIKMYKLMCNNLQAFPAQGWCFKEHLEGWMLDLANHDTCYWIEDPEGNRMNGDFKLI